MDDVYWCIGPRICIAAALESSKVLLKRFPASIVHSADRADGADIIFRRSVDSDDSGSGSALSTEQNIDAKRSKKGLYPTQVPGQGARIFYPPRSVAYLQAICGANSEKIRGGTRPRAALVHEFPN